MDILTKDATFRYQLLDRMRCDCEYFLNYGNRCNKFLWAGEPKEQIDTMLKLWDSFPDDEKPEWLSREQINAYARKMGVEL